MKKRRKNEDELAIYAYCLFVSFTKENPFDE